MNTISLKNFVKLVNNQIVRIVKRGTRYEFQYGDRVLHSLDIRCTNLKRLTAHWAGFITAAQKVSVTMSTQAKHAIQAAQSNWGLYATVRFLKKRGVPFRLYVLASQLQAAARGGF